jgi:glucose-6-phosphate 1-dehydrogenase
VDRADGRPRRDLGTRAGRRGLELFRVARADPKGLVHAPIVPQASSARRPRADSGRHRGVIERLVLFGATGDLAGRFLLPGLTQLEATSKLPAELRIVGAAQEDWDDEAFRDHVSGQLDEHAGDLPRAAREAVCRKLNYRSADVADPRSVARVLDAAEADGRPVAVYLALPARMFTPAVTALGVIGLPRGSRMALEKPFGESLGSAIALNALLARVTGVAGEQAVFRVDHALGMATVQNLLGVRLTNRVWEPLWNSLHIEQVDLLWEEDLALEGRAGFYDRTGALKDVIQNHLLQVLCLVAMEPPTSVDERDLRDRKMDVLRGVRPLTPSDVASKTRRARYTAGQVGERAIPNYVQEPGIDPDRETETFAEIVLELDTWRWAGTPFLLRTGKALARRRKELVVRFRQVPHLPLAEDNTVPPANELRIGLDGPYDLTLSMTGSAGGSPPELAPLTLTAALPATERPPYARVLLDVLAGESTLSIRGDEAEQAWRILTPVLRGWADGLVPLEEYPAGSAGPPCRDADTPHDE